jgi:hypothetical protein
MERRRGIGLRIFCVRATRGLRRPSLDTRSGAQSGYPWNLRRQDLAVALLWLIFEREVMGDRLRRGWLRHDETIGVAQPHKPLMQISVPGSEVESYH